MYAISDTDSSTSPGFFSSAISGIENAGTAVVNGVEAGVGAAFHGAGAVVGEVSSVLGKAEDKILSPVTGPLKWVAIGLVALGGIYILLEWRQAHGKAF